MKFTSFCSLAKPFFSPKIFRQTASSAFFSSIDLALLRAFSFEISSLKPIFLQLNLLKLCKISTFLFRFKFKLSPTSSFFILPSIFVGTKSLTAAHITSKFAPSHSLLQSSKSSLLELNLRLRNGSPLVLKLASSFTSAPA